MAVTKRRYTMTSRAQKAQATRDRIRAAAMTLYGERSLETFTLEDVARLAQTTVQTVLRAYGSKEDLVMAALTALMQKGTPAKPASTGDLADAVREIFDIYETIGDVVIARLADERRLPGLNAQLEEGRAGHGEWVAHVFAPYVRANSDLFEMLNVMTDVYVWKLLRRDRGLDRSAAQSIMLKMITSALKGACDGESALA